ncbi:MAG: helix-hairpin-helix domain-containing protein [Sulfurimonas sp.]
MKILAMLVLGMSLLFGVVDINSASQKELTTLKGVGAKKASEIVKYRKAHCFKNVGEIVKVKGLGKKFLEKNRANLKAGACKK